MKSKELQALTGDTRRAKYHEFFFEICHYRSPCNIYFFNNTHLRGHQKMGKSSVSNEATSSKSTEELRQKLDELRQSRKATEETLSDCRMRWERMREEEIKFADPEDVEGLLDNYDDDCSGPTVQSFAIEPAFMDSGEGMAIPNDHEEQSLCSVLNIIWMELIGLVLTVYTLIRTSKRKE